ncbi:MAG: FISUMP domain-containing protein [Candidatus Paceibacterota bacterium]
MQKNKLRLGFTLIELLVVIAIIGVLSGFIFISMSGTINAAKDAKRKVDVMNIQKSILMYLTENNNAYPSTTNCNIKDPGVNGCGAGFDLALQPYLPNLPTDPDSNTVYYTYTYSGTGPVFTVSATLSNGNTYSYSSDSGFSESTPFTCGDTLIDSRDSKSYSTVLIGSQCWMAKNLDYDSGCTAITWVNNSDVGYCGYYTGGPFTDEGLLYQWSTAMGSTSGNPGICPTGWHVATDAEWYTLENYLKDSGQTCDAARGTPNGSPSDCATAGTKMRAVAAGGSNSSGFSGLFTGFREYDGSYYNSRPDYGIFWSSSVYGTSAIYRELMTGSTMVTRYSNLKASAYSIRCLKN